MQRKKNLTQFKCYLTKVCLNKVFFFNYVNALIYKISEKFIFISAIILIMKLLREKSAFVLIG